MESDGSFLSISSLWSLKNSQELKKVWQQKVTTQQECIKLRMRGKAIYISRKVQNWEQEKNCQSALRMCGIRKERKLARYRMPMSHPPPPSENSHPFLIGLPCAPRLSRPSPFTLAFPPWNPPCYGHHCPCSAHVPFLAPKLREANPQLLGCSTRPTAK